MAQLPAGFVPDGFVPDPKVAAPPPAKAEKPRNNISRIPDPEGGLALSQIADDNPKAAAMGAVSGMVAPFVPAAVGIGARAASTAAQFVNPELVGILSPRLGNIVRVAQKIGTVGGLLKAAQESQQAPKLALSAMDVIRLKDLIAKGVSQVDALQILQAAKAGINRIP